VSFLNVIGMMPIFAALIVSTMWATSCILGLVGLVGNFQPNPSREFSGNVSTGIILALICTAITLAISFSLIKLARSVHFTRSPAIVLVGVLLGMLWTGLSSVSAWQPWARAGQEIDKQFARHKIESERPANTAAPSRPSAP